MRNSRFYQIGIKNKVVKSEKRIRLPNQKKRWVNNQGKNIVSPIKIYWKKSRLLNKDRIDIIMFFQIYKVLFLVPN